MKVVPDTNIIPGSISPFSKYRLVMDRFEKGDYILCLSTDIMLEYEEKLAENFNPAVAELFTGGLLLKKKHRVPKNYNAQNGRIYGTLGANALNALLALFIIINSLFRKCPNSPLNSSAKT